MRKLLQAMSVSAFLTLGGCTPDLASIQQATVAACGFLPTAVTVAGLFPNPYTVPAAVIAAAICDAVASQVPLAERRQLRSTRKAIKVVVGVGGQNYVIQGQFVR